MLNISRPNVFGKFVLIVNSIENLIYQRAVSCYANGMWKLAFEVVVMFSWEREQSSKFNDVKPSKAPNKHTHSKHFGCFSCDDYQSQQKSLTPFPLFDVASIQISLNLCGLHSINFWVAICDHQTYKFPQGIGKN